MWLSNNFPAKVFEKLFMKASKAFLASAAVLVLGAFMTVLNKLKQVCKVTF